VLIFLELQICIFFANYPGIDLKKIAIVDKMFEIPDLPSQVSRDFARKINIIKIHNLFSFQTSAGVCYLWALNKLWKRLQSQPGN
jgi:hypothetical protein